MNNDTKENKLYGGAIMNMGVDFRKNVVPTLPDTIICPLCKEKHEKKNLKYATNMLRSRFRSKYKDGIRVRSYKTPSVLRTPIADIATSQLQSEILGEVYAVPSEFLGTCFYFCCNNCSYMFEYRNQKSEKIIRKKLYDKKKKKITKKKTIQKSSTKTKTIRKSNSNDE